MWRHLVPAIVRRCRNRSWSTVLGSVLTAPTMSLSGGKEAYAFLVGAPVFKTGERRHPSLAGSIPVRLRTCSDLRERRLHRAAGHGVVVADQAGGPLVPDRERSSFRCPSSVSHAAISESCASS